MILRQRSIIATGIAVCLWVAPVWAQTLPADVVDPAFREAVQALENGDATTAQDVVADADLLTRDLLRWMQYRDGIGSFDEMAAFLPARADWPGLSRIRANAEEQMAETRPANVLAFFDKADVETGRGAVAYANALIAMNRRDQAEAMLIDVWTSDALSDESHQAILDAYPDIIAPYHSTRADMLLWRWRTSDANNVLPLLPSDQAALTSARIAIITRADDVTQRIERVPGGLRDNAGLQYDRFNWFADRGDWTQASAILLDRSSSADALGVPWRWGSWRRILARWQMREGNVDRAYELASQHFIAADQSNYSDLEWLSGYLALTYQKDYARALQHFKNFDASVSSPISKGRAGYWLGRAHEGLGNAEAAITSFQAGAQHQTSFYGLLSAEKLGLTLNPDLIGAENFGDWRTSPVIRNDMVRAGLALLDVGERGLAVLFFRDAAADMSRQEIGQLGAMFMDIGEPFYAILIAKTAVRGDVLVQDVYFPIHPMVNLNLPVDPALALSVARQESEFRTDAGSSVGALGLMQLMPATAQDVAGWLDMPYNRGRLTSDWQYNATLGSEYLAYLTREFGESPVMIAAGYNAGPSRPKTWMNDRGDPRRGFGNADPVDVVDWIEHIPFRETRNYTMRVTEGMAVYRARLSGRIGPVRFTDLLVGELPIIRPVARPNTLQTAIPPTVRSAGEQAPTSPAGPQSIRPVSRAGD